MGVVEDLLKLKASAKFIDMTHPLEDGIPHWFTQPGVTAVVGTRYTEDGSFWRTVTMCEHSGTHIDAFSHFFEGGENVDQIPAERLMGRGVNIDVTGTAPRGVTSVEDVKKFEAKYGEIKEGDIVFFRFGWDKKWAIGDAGKPFMEDWPGTSKETAEYLLSKKVAAVGTDTCALDAIGTTNPSHKVLLGNGINIIENVNNLDILPAFFGVIGLPNKFKDGSGSPLRLIAMIDK